MNLTTIEQIRKHNAKPIDEKSIKEIRDVIEWHYGSGGVNNQMCCTAVDLFLLGYIKGEKSREEIESIGVSDQDRGSAC